MRGIGTEMERSRSQSISTGSLSETIASSRPRYRPQRERERAESEQEDEQVDEFTDPRNQPDQGDPDDAEQERDPPVRAVESVEHPRSEGVPTVHGSDPERDDVGHDPDERQRNTDDRDRHEGEEDWGSDQREEPDPPLASGPSLTRSATSSEKRGNASRRTAPSTRLTATPYADPNHSGTRSPPKPTPGVAAEARVSTTPPPPATVGLWVNVPASYRNSPPTSALGPITTESAAERTSADSAVDADRARAGVERAVDSARLRQLEKAGPELGVPADRAVDDHGSGGDLNVSVDAARFRDPDQAGRAGEVTLNGAVHDNRAGHALDAVNRLTLVDDDRPGRALDRLGCRESRRERREERDERERDGETTTTSGAT